MQSGSGQQHSTRSSQENLFGVKVQVQGIKGQPYVVLNSPSHKSQADISVITHQAGYNPGMVRRSLEERQSPPEMRRVAGSSALHCQKHPEILRPYDPENNNLNRVASSQKAPQTTDFSTETISSAPTNRPRIPLPAGNPTDDSSEASRSKSPLSSGPNTVETDSIMSVGKLISQFNSNLRRGRGLRNRLDPESLQRSRSVDTGRTSDYSSSSSSSSRASSLKGIRGETQSGAYPPGSARARLLSGESPLAGTVEENKPSPLVRTQQSKEAMQQQQEQKQQQQQQQEQQQLAKIPPDIEKLTITKTFGDQILEADQRDVPVTPDLLKGQQELSADPPEDATKQMLFLYLKNGTTDDDFTIQQKVDLLLARVDKLKWRTAENIEEEQEEKECESKTKLLQDKHTSLEKEVSQLKKKVELEIKNEMILAKAFEKSRTEKKKLQEELVRTKAELRRLRDELSDVEAELQSTKEELTQMKAERERTKAEMKDLQQQLSEMHDELDQAKKADVISTDKEVLLKDLAQLRADFQEMLQMKEEQEDVLHHKEKELRDLKGAFKEETETHDKYIAALKDEYKQELDELLKDLELAKERNNLLGQEKVSVEQERGAVRVQLRDLNLEKDQLKGRVRDLNSKVDQLSEAIQESKAKERAMEQRVKQLEREKEQVEEMLGDVRRNEEDMCQSNKSLLFRLEDVQGKLTKLNHEHRELKEKLKDEKRQVEELWKMKSELEDERRVQDRTMEQLQKKMNSIVEECEASTDVLQNQVDEARERSQRELVELRRQLQEKGSELEKSRQAAKKLQEELLPLEESLQRCRKEQQEALLRGRQLEQRAGELEGKNAAVLEERERQIKLMEGRISHLEEDLKDERSSADRLMERLDKTKEQMDLLRNDLMQERTIKQDLECDKISLERQNKELKGRVTYLEGSQRNNQDSTVSKLNNRIQELEERLQGEERDKNNLQQVNRKLERKVKELKLHSDEERINLQTQSDQLTQRLKTAKRQMDEAEEEIERLEHAKKKLQRELDEQMEANEQLHGQLSAMRNEMRRKKKPAAITKHAEDDGTEAEDFESD